MSGRILLLVAAVVLAAAVLMLRLGAGFVATYPRSNVLIVSIDTLRPDHLASYGYGRVTSPGIDALARRGITFENAFAPRGSTWPSLATMLTSLSPITTNVRENGHYLRPGTATLADILRTEGYVSRAFVSGSICHLTRRIPAFEHTFCGEDEPVTDRAVEFLRTADDRPFFAWVHLIAPHGPYDPPAEYDKFTNAGYRGPVGRDQATLGALIRNQKPLSDADRAQLYGLYDGEILFADALVDRMLDALDERGLRENTVIAFLSDHGEELADHNGYLYHSCSVYDSVLRIPLVIALPGDALAGTRVTPIVQTEDLAPTLLDLVGVARLPTFEGESLRPLLGGKPGAQESEAERIAWSEWYDMNVSNTVQTLRTSRWRYVSNPHGITPKCPPKGNYYKIAREELYDHTNDPLDQHDVAAAHPDVVRHLAALAEQAAAASTSVAPQQMDKNLEEELRSFGYVE